MDIWSGLTREPSPQRVSKPCLCSSPHHTEVAKKLLAHGPLSAREFREITGWPRRLCYGTLHVLTRNKTLRRRGDVRGYVYELAQ